jgi:hypothetical protein
MASRRENNSLSESFWRTTSTDYDKVQQWPAWKQAIKITSATSSSGEFIVTRRDKDLPLVKNKE